MRIIIPLNPIPKKNNTQIIRNKKTKRLQIIQSARYIQYERDCGYFLNRYKPREPIGRPVNLKCHFYRKTRHKIDLINLLESAQDVLVKHGVLKDDNSDVVVSTDGSRVFYDKENPRTEIEICVIE